jgi:hypothetical protein
MERRAHTGHGALLFVIPVSAPKTQFALPCTR